MENQCSKTNPNVIFSNFPSQHSAFERRGAAWEASRPFMALRRFPTLYYPRSMSEYIPTCIHLHILQIEDARAAMMLCLKHRKEWEKSIKDFARLKEKQKKRKPKKKNWSLRRPASENAS
ncbi:hypothetical protein RND71_037161 [Anisodus tanguticus]|uniref:Uncharacterized protein n=1 Tax=Anisodus tanguticus TaxID=243964 RepID=A0AAE1R506_9SOLA|nr:hypothetical protein RND71_037161 [Anisodus tanguticus]